MKRSVPTPPLASLPVAQATGQSLLEELQRQRQVIQRSHEQLRSTDAAVAQSGAVLKRMSKWWNLF